MRLVNDQVFVCLPVPIAGASKPLRLVLVKSSGDRATRTGPLVAREADMVCKRRPAVCRYVRIVRTRRRKAPPALMLMLSSELELCEVGPG